MKTAPIPANEAERLRALQDLHLLDTLPEERFDRITRLSAALFRVPIALVSLVDQDRQWFKSKVGLDAEQTPREVSFCGHGVAQRDSPYLVVPDSSKDPRFADNPLVEGVPHARFYAGRVLRAGNRALAVGMLCVIDNKPRDFGSGDRALLDDLAALVEEELELSETRHMAQEMIAAREKADAASEAKSRFLANMSHELRTPLNSIIGFAQVLAKNKEGALGPQDLVYLGRISENGRHLLELINDVLDIAKIEAGKMEFEIGAVDLSAIVASIVGVLEPEAAAKGVELKTVLPAGLAPLPADARKLKQILLNLAGNALKFTDHGSVILRVIADAAGRPRRIEVEDSGVGIPADQLQRIFGSFEQADNSAQRRHGGTGLGLTISRDLARAMGFDLKVESRLGAGSVFYMDLPARRR